MTVSSPYSLRLDCLRLEIRTDDSQFPLRPGINCLRLEIEETKVLSIRVGQVENNDLSRLIQMTIFFLEMMVDES
jgi:hypothetical protein